MDLPHIPTHHTIYSFNRPDLLTSLLPRYFRNAVDRDELKTRHLIRKILAQGPFKEKTIAMHAEEAGRGAIWIT
jgi:hypothetical protein